MADIIDFESKRKEIEAKRPPKVVDLDYFKGSVTFEECQSLVEAFEYFMEQTLVGESKMRISGPIFESMMSKFEFDLTEYFECIDSGPNKRA